MYASDQHRVYNNVCVCVPPMSGVSLCVCETLADGHSARAPPSLTHHILSAPLRSNTRIHTRMQRTAKPPSPHRARVHRAENQTQHKASCTRTRASGMHHRTDRGRSSGARPPFKRSCVCVFVCLQRIVFKQLCSVVWKHFDRIFRV